MKQSYIIPIVFVSVLIFLSGNIYAQSFKKGSLLVSVSEGVTYTHYSTSATGSEVIHKDHINGDRDPITVEYGLTSTGGWVSTLEEIFCT